MTIRFNVLDNSCLLGEEEFPAGENEVQKPSKELVRLANHAHAAGAIELEGADPEAHGVQSQKDGEAAYAAAHADGSWHESNAVQAELDAEAKATVTAEIASANASTDDDPEE